MGSGGRGSRTRIKKRCENFSRSNAPQIDRSPPGVERCDILSRWELEVQSYFRDRGCGRAKKRGTRRLLLARRSGVIVAAADTEVSISKDGDGSYVNFFICAVAINVSERGKGGRLARELVQVLKDCAVQKAREGGLPRAKVYGRIDANNEPSVHLVDDMGFELEQMESVHLQTWSTMLGV